MQKIILKTRSEQIILISLIMSILMILIFWILNKYSQQINLDILESHSKEVHMESTRLQIYFYGIFIFSLGLIVIYFLYTKNLNSLCAKHLKSSVFNGCFMAFVASIFLFGNFDRPFTFGFFSTLVIVLIARKNNLLKKINFSILRNILAILLLLYLILFVAIPFFAPPVIFDNDFLVSVNTHFAMTVLPGFDFACCDNTGFLERTNYGYGMTLLTAMAIKLIQLFTNSQDNILFLIVRIYQLLSILLAIYAASMINKKNMIVVVAIMIFTSVTMNTLGYSNYFPNQSGIRYVPFLIGLIFIIQLWKKENSNIFLFSLGSATFIFLSPETGIALSAGLITLRFLQTFSKEDPLLTISVELIKLTFFSTTIYVLLNYLAVYYFDPTSNASPLENLKLWSSGYGGLSNNLSPFAGLLFFFSTLNLLRSFYLVSISRSTKISVLQGALSATILAWLPYYINRMAEWNLWFQSILFALVIAPYINKKSIHMLCTKSRAISACTLLVFCLIGALGVVSLNRLRVESRLYLFSYQSDCSLTFTLFQKTCFIDKRILDSTNYFNNLLPFRDNGKHLILSHRSLELKLLGFNQKFPWYEPFGEIATQNNLLNLITWLEKNRPLFIHTDNPRSELSLSLPNRTAHFQGIMSRLHSYKLIHTDDNWQTYILKSSRDSDK